MNSDMRPEHAAPADGHALSFPVGSLPEKHGGGWPPDKSAIPPGYICKEHGVYFRDEDGQGNRTEEWVCSPLAVRAMTRDSRGKAWGRLLVLIDSDGIEHTWAMPMAMMGGGGEEYRRELLSLGLRIAAGKGNPRLHNYLAMSQSVNRACCVPRIGWHARRFVLPGEVYGQQEEDEQILLQGADDAGALQVAGSLVEWQEHVGRLCRGNSRLVFAVSTAFAAPLLHLINQESGGFHYIGGSSLGKTTALHVAGSVCGGGGINGYIRQWRTTANGLESIAAVSCDCLLCLDEMSQVDGRTVGEVAYMLANGQGKSRARRDGGIKAPAEWRILFLSTGEVGLADKVVEDGRRRSMAGQAVRVVDVPADAGKGLGLFEDLHGRADGDKFARDLREGTKRFYGSPLRPFLAQITARYDDVAQTVADSIRRFAQEHCPGDADGQVKRVCARFALVAAAGEAATDFGVLPWPKGEASQAALRCFSDWLERRGGNGAAETLTGLRQVRAFFEAYGASRFETWGEKADEPKVVNRAGFRKKNESGDWEYFVLPSVYKEELCRGLDSKRVTADLVDRKLLLPEGPGHVQKKLRVPGAGQVRLYHFSAAVISDERVQP